jgi:hypothetical protein
MKTALFVAALVLELSSIAAVAQPSPQPPPGGTVFTPRGPGFVTGPARGGLQTTILPNEGGQGILENNGNGTSTLITPQGQISTVPNAR